MWRRFIKLWWIVSPQHRRRNLNMESLHNPSPSENAGEYFKRISEATDNSSWLEFYNAILKVSAATSVKLLKMAKESEIDTALGLSKLSDGYKKALCEYLAPYQCSKVFVFGPTGPTPEALPRSMKTCSKKFKSQMDRQSLGNELGETELSQLKFPDGLFDGICCGREVPMRAKGKHGTAAVADRVWAWAIAKWGNLHVDQQFCDTMCDLLSARWPNIQEWGGKERDWATIIRNRFGNARAAPDGAYKTSVIPTIDLTEPAKRLLQESGFHMHVDDEARSMYERGGTSLGTTTASSALVATAPIAEGMPVPARRGVRVARGVAAVASDAATAARSAIDLPSSAAASPLASVTLQDDSSDDDLPLVAARDARVAARKKADNDAAATPSTPSSAPKPPPAKPPPTNKKQRREPPKPVLPFEDCELAREWSVVSEHEASSVGNNVADPKGLGDPELRVAKLFPLGGGTEHDWFLGTVNIELVRKKFFWVTYVDDGAEYRNQFYPKGYGVEWCYLRKKSVSPTDGSSPAASPAAASSAARTRGGFANYFATTVEECSQLGV